MKGKIQKIREEVEKRYEYWKEKESNSHSIESEIRMSECQHFLLMLDSSQEEPVSTKDKLLALSDGKLHLGWIDDAKVVEFEECLIQFHEDMNNIPQGTDSLTRLKDTDGVLHSYSKKLMSIAKKEPVSEDLDEAAEGYGIRQGAELKPFAIKFFNAGAQWQKAKDQSTIELAEDHAMLAGMNKMEEQMMAKAIDGEVITTSDYGWENIRVHKKEHHCGQKVKVIVIKED